MSLNLSGEDEPHALGESSDDSASILQRRSRHCGSIESLRSKPGSDSPRQSVQQSGNKHRPNFCEPGSFGEPPEGVEESPIKRVARAKALAGAGLPRWPTYVPPGPLDYDERRRRRLYVEKADYALLNHLKMEAMFRPRTPALMLALKMKARKFLEKFDLSEAFPHELVEMVANSVAIAMDISEEEEGVRQHLKHPQQSILRAKHALMLREGYVGARRPYGRKVPVYLPTA